MKKHRKARGLLVEHEFSRGIGSSRMGWYLLFWFDELKNVLCGYWFFAPNLGGNVIIFKNETNASVHNYKQGDLGLLWRN